MSSRFLGMCCSFLSLPRDISPQRSLLRFSASLLLVPPVVTPSGSFRVKHLLTIVFSKHARHGLWAQIELRHVQCRQSFQRQLFRDLADRADGDNSLGMGILEFHARFVLSGHQVAGFHSYHNCEAVGFPYHQGEEGRNKLKCLKLHCFSKTRPIFMKKSSSVVMCSISSKARVAIRVIARGPQ